METVPTAVNKSVDSYSVPANSRHHLFPSTSTMPVFMTKHIDAKQDRWRTIGMTLLGILWCQLVTCAAEELQEAKPKCGIYLAPSSIPGSGLGMYAGDKYYKKKDLVTFGDTVIPISEYDWNNDDGPYHGDSFLWDEYTWNSPVFDGMEDEGDDPDLIMVASPGVGAAANSYLSLVNVDDFLIKMGRGVDGNSPGVGASTIYYGREFFATRDIPPGGEIFVDYGENYFKSRSSTYGYLPLPSTFMMTNALLNKYSRMKATANRRQEKSADFWKDYYDIITQVRSTWKTSRILNGFPDEEDLISHILASGGASQQHFNRSIRELSWLEEHGQCMDNIKEGNSTNPDAARGAFANRFIPKGGLVAPAPLIHIHDYNTMKVYLPKDDESNPGKFVPNRDGPFMFQLLMNYCFGHEQSTLLLCPYGLLTAFINHSHENPNTRIQWSQQMRHPEWREKPISEWWEIYHTGLQIDFVALRDINEDEEIFIDYGAAWESAWQEHVKHFVPRKNYIPSFELNELVDIDYRTADDQDYEANDVFLMCRAWYVKQFVKQNDDSHCRVLKKLGNDRYLVQLMEVNYFDKEGYTEMTEGRLLWNVPSDALFFVDIPYTRDHYQLNAFRHAMMIPDDMFPDVWKNIQ